MGIKGNIWKAVKVAKNLNHDSIPKNLTLNGLSVAECDIAKCFAEICNSKVISKVE